MKPPPSWLPPSDSPKWKKRRWRDGLGCYRVRTLANPSAPRNPEMLLNHLTRPSSPGPYRDLVDAVIAEAKRYHLIKPHGGESRAEFEARSEIAWDKVLVAVDACLDWEQRAHLRAVRAAGVSGGQVPSDDPGD